jgi:hypothetical protein
MAIGEQVTGVISYVIIAVSAVFGLYNSISYLYLSGDRSTLTVITNAIYEYLKGAVYGGFIL